MARKMTAPQGGVAEGQASDSRTAPPAYTAPDAGSTHTSSRAMPGTGSPPDVAKPRRRDPLRRAGAGGRWWVWVGRAVLWAFIIVIVVNGGRAAYLGFTEQAAPTRAATEEGRTQFPTRAAAAYAQQFATIYLNYDEASAGARARKLASYLPQGVDPQLGWNGAGRLSLDAVHLAGVDVRDDTHAVVKLAVLVNGNWMRLAVPVYAAGDGMVVSGQPALLPAPPKASLPASPGAPEIDVEATNELTRQLPGFFKAYATSDSADLDRYLDQGVSVAGLSGAVRFVSLQDVRVPPGDRTRNITATVVWGIPTAKEGMPAGELAQTYELTVTKQNGNWYVKDIKGSTMRSGQ